MGLALFLQVAFMVASVAWSAYKWYSARGEKATVAYFDEANLPRANEGDPVSLVYGTVRIRGATLVAFAPGAVPVEEVTGKGLRYFIDARFVLCLSNDRVEYMGLGGAATFLKLLVGDKEVGGFAPQGDPNPANGVTAWSVLDPNVMGGEALGGGGVISGGFLFYDGRWVQDLVPLETDPGTDLGNTPNYRGFVCVRLAAWGVGMSPNLPAYSFVINNPVHIKDYASVSGPITDGDANPAAVLWDLLTNEWGRIGNPTSAVDTDSFVAAAATLQDEQHGMSAVISSTNEARAVIEQILRQIDGVIYEDPVTRRYVLTLAREDYDPNTIVEFDASNVLEPPEMSTTLWEETVNEVRVIYTNPVSGYEEATALAQDLALINAQGGRRRTAEIRFPFCTHQQLAFTLAQRELNFLSRPIAKLRLTVNRDGFDLHPGQPFWFRWPEWNFEMIFRVVDVDVGTIEHGSVVINAVQDRFSIAGRVYDPPNDEVAEVPPTPDPIQLRTITEAPRWIMLKAFEAGTINSVDVQRSLSLARPEGVDSRYKAVTSINGGSEAGDAPPRAFPAGFIVDATYLRTTSAYDTTTGLRISGLYGTTLASATQTEIATQGKNLIQVGGEIMAFESATDLGGGDWRLDNVWRGLLDTVPDDHLAGAQGYFLPGSYATGALGTLALVHGAAVVTHTQAAAGSTWTPSEDSPEDAFTARSRTLLSYPGADLKVRGSKTPAALEEGGVTVEWRARDRLKGTITRPDAAAETVEAGTSYDVVAQKTVQAQTGARIVQAAGHASSSTTEVPLGAAGHGALEVGVETKRTVALPDGTAPSLGSWQVPLLNVTAHHWRNLLRNPRFAVGTLYWTTVSGTPATYAGVSSGLGAGGSYVAGGAAGGTVELRQDVNVTGYQPKNLTAILRFYVANLNGDAGDTVTVELISLNAAGTALQTQTYGPSAPGVWGWQELSIADLHDDTASLRVRLVLTPVGELDTTADVAVTECILRVGQISAQLLSNASFEAGTTSWTTGAGGWAIQTTTPYDLANYVRPTDGASAQLYQQVALPTGYEQGAAVLECARMNDDADDTGTVTLQARDGGGAVVASVTTGAEAISPSNVWQRRRLVLDPIPATATDLRVVIDAARVTGTPLNACFDDVDLRVHKHLDPDEEARYSYESATRAVQPLPDTTWAWKAAFPTVPAPDYAIFDGGLVGRLGVEPLMEADAGVLTGAKAVAHHAKGETATCYEGAGSFYAGFVDADVHTAPIGTAFANFGDADPFSALTFFRYNDTHQVACGLMGRKVDTLGWSLAITATGKVEAKLYGASATKTATGTQTVTDGALHGAGLIHAPATTDLHLVDGAGVVTTDTAGMGSFRATAPGRFRLLRSTASEVALHGQLIRGYLWRQALTTAQMQAVIKYAAAATDWGTISSMTRTGSIACVTGSDADGVLVETFGPGRVAIARDVGSGRDGLVTMPAITNLAAASFGDDEPWWTVEGATVALRAAVDPRGYKEAAQITGASTTSYRMDGIAFGAAAATIYVSFLARADVPHSMTVDLQASLGSDLDPQDVALTTQWQVYTLTMSWTDDDLTGEGRIRFCPSNDGTARTIYLSPLISVSTVKPYPGDFPIGAPGATLPVVDLDLGAQLNREGELEVECALVDADATIADAHNGTNSNDRRTIAWNQELASDLESLHYDAAGTADASAELTDTTINEAAPFKARLRWCRAGLVDGLASAFVAMRAEQGATVASDAGRVATFSASSTALTALRLGHDASALNRMAGRIFNVRLSARERKV